MTDDISPKRRICQGNLYSLYPPLYIIIFYVHEGEKYEKSGEKIVKVVSKNNLLYEFYDFS